MADFWDWLGGIFGGGNSAAPAAKAAPARPNSSSRPAASPRPTGGGGMGGGLSRGGFAPQSRDDQYTPQPVSNWLESPPDYSRFLQNDVPAQPGQMQNGADLLLQVLRSTPEGRETWQQPDAAYLAAAGDTTPTISRRDQRTADLQTPGGYRDQEMSIEEYEALNPRQRAVVDANTVLVNAIKADRSLWAEQPSAKGDDEYNSLVESIFGKEGGSDRYAPNTVSALAQLGISGPKTYDLDNYLNLSSLVTSDDLAFLTEEALAATPAGTSTNGRENNARNLSARAQESLMAALQTGQSLLDAFGVRSEETDIVGAQPNSNERDARLAQFFEGAINRSNRTDPEVAREALGGFAQEFGLDSQSIFDYFERRLSQLDLNNARGGEQNPDWLTPEEFRATYYRGEG